MSCVQVNGLTSVELLVVAFIVTDLQDLICNTSTLQPNFKLRGDQ